MAMRLHFYVFPVLIVLLGSTCWSQVTYTIERVTGEIELDGELTENRSGSQANLQQPEKDRCFEDRSTMTAT